MTFYNVVYLTFSLIIILTINFSFDIKVLEKCYVVWSEDAPWREDMYKGVDFYLHFYFIDFS